MRLLVLATLLLVAAIIDAPIAAGAGIEPSVGADGGGRTTAVDRRDESALAFAAVPADVLGFVRLRDGRALLDAPGGRATGAALLALLGADEPAARWRALADRLGWSPEEALRRLVGRDARLVLRAEPDGSIDWAVVTLVEREDVDRIVKALRPTLVPGGRYDLPADRLTFSYRKGRLLVAADPQSRLFRELSAPRLPDAGPSARAGSLAAVVETLLPDAGRDELLGRRLVMVLPSLGSPEGRALIAADLEDDERVVATVHTRLDRDSRDRGCRGVAARGVTELVAALAEDALFVMVDPIAADDATDPLVAVGLATLRPPAEQSAGALRIIAVGECRSSDRSPAGCAMKRPAIAIAYEVGDAAAARTTQDAAVRDACTRLGIDPPRDERRRVELAPALERAIGPHPLLTGCGLHWRVVERGRCGWQVYATDALWLDRIAARLATLHGPAGDDAPEDARISSAGRLCGARVSEHLRTWIGEAKRFAPERPETFAQGIALLAEIGSRFRCIEWTARHDAERRFELTISALLAPVDGR